MRVCSITAESAVTHIQPRSEQHLLYQEVSISKYSRTESVCLFYPLITLVLLQS